MTPDQKWDPIPKHAITLPELPRQWMLPERFTDVDGRPYVRCYLHGLIPADHRCDASPSDHLCGVAAHPNQIEGEDHDDQCTSHGDWSAMQSSKLHYIVRLHAKKVDEAGGTEGECEECGLPWPCRTYHMAAAWGEANDCEDAGWCRHAGIPLLKWW